MKINNVKPGDQLMRVFPNKPQNWTSDAFVTQVDESTITCTVMVDVPRTMQFSKATGISVLGEEYGWLALKEGEAHEY